jgi:putative ABC transport system permease protein
MSDFRFLARRKALTAVAVVTMALALGANTAALSVLEAFLFSSLGVPDPQRVVDVIPQRNLPGRGTVDFSEAYPNYELLRKTQRAFADVTVFLQLQTSWSDGAESRALDAARVSASFFSTMRVQPVLGRAFIASEEGPSPAPVVIISHALWVSSFASDPAVIGHTISLDGAPHSIVGVMPEGFAQPLPTDVWLPFDIPASQRTAVSGARQLTVYARMAEGVSDAAARADIERFGTRAIEMRAADNKDFRYNIKTLREVLLDSASSSALFVQTGAATLLVLAILNLASLLIAWGFERQQELAVRVALGASQRRVATLLLRPSIMIVTAGMVLGVAIAFIALHILQQFDLGPTVTVLVARARLDSTFLLATGVIAALAGLIAGMVPALFSRDAEIGDTLRASSRSATLSPAALRWQKAMVLGQAAFSTTILAAALLVGVSFWRLSSIPNGFSAGGRIVARIVLPDAVYGAHAKRAAFGRALDDNLAAEPELRTAGFTTTLPVSDQVWGGRFFIELPDRSTSKEPALFHLRRISRNYLRTMGIPLLRGRTFTTADDTGAVQVAIVSRALAERLWPNEDPIGKRLLRATSANVPPTPISVVGLVGNTMDAGYSSPAGEAVYLPYAQVSSIRVSIVIQTRGDTRAALAALKRALKKTDPTIAISNVAMLDGLVLQANALPRLRTLVLLLFSVVAVGIVSLGSYGVMSQLVSNRERELAVRLIFGARRGQLGTSVLTQAARLTAPGILLGLVVVWSVGGLLDTFAFGVHARSPSVLATAGTALLLLAFAAAASPALRAMRVDIRRGMSS